MPLFLHPNIYRKTTLEHLTSIETPSKLYEIGLYLIVLNFLAQMKLCLHAKIIYKIKLFLQVFLGVPIEDACSKRSSYGTAY